MYVRFYELYCVNGKINSGFLSSKRKMHSKIIRIGNM